MTEQDGCRKSRTMAVMTAAVVHFATRPHTLSQAFNTPTREVKRSPIHLISINPSGDPHMSCARGASVVSL